MTDTARELADKIMITLGTKTKALFVNKLHEEMVTQNSRLNYADIVDVATKMKVMI